MIPWRVKNFLSTHFPLAYHFAVNLGLKGNSQEHWDQMLAASWNDASRAWPTKNELILGKTDPSMKILDVACGTGGILRALHDKGYRNLHALEISQYAVDRLNAEGIFGKQGSLPKIDFPDAGFDVVIASQVLEHVIRRHTFVKEIHRVLRPGGRAFIFVPDQCLGPIDEPEHVIVYSRDKLAAFLGKYFAVDSIDSIKDANHRMPILFAEVSKRAD
ncbi:MAG: class I SAM-dependent methyltransferase [Rhodocyclaceae bacterium]|nr:class I SAM-dependent methyltransferase [Rhodocyclaceae bacterium]